VATGQEQPGLLAEGQSLAGWGQLAAV